MRNNITVGIDIGTHQIKVMVVEHTIENGRAVPKIIATGLSESKGLRYGYIINTPDVTRCIQSAVSDASKKANMPIDSAFVSVGGIGLSSASSTGSTIISRADTKITELDIENVMQIAEDELPTQHSINRKIINALPLQFKLDGKIVLGNPLDLKGGKLEVKALFITILENHFNDVVQTVINAGIDVIDVKASPIASSIVLLSKTQKIAGCVLVNIGAETVSLVVYENSIPISLEVFPIGSTDITNDIALGLKISLDDAESFKTNTKSSSASRRKLEEIILARLSDIFELIEGHLRKINRNALLPAGIIISGGGSAITSIEDFARTALRLPSQLGKVQFIGEDSSGVISDSTWSVVYGLCILGYYDNTASNSNLKQITNKFIRSATLWVKQFLP